MEAVAEWSQSGEQFYHTDQDGDSVTLDRNAKSETLWLGTDGCGEVLFTSRAQVEEFANALLVMAGKVWK